MKISRAIPAVIAVLLILFASCKDQKTYIDRLKDESRAIDRFISRNNITVLERFPEDSVFQSNQFYKDPSSGVYYQIADYGEKNRKITLGEEIYIRFEGLKYFMTDDSTTFSNSDPDRSPMPQTLIFRGPVNPNTKGYYDTPGWAVPLPVIGHNAVVKMIVPFEMGSSYDQQQYQPTYYDRVTYRFEHHQR